MQRSHLLFMAVITACSQGATGPGQPNRDFEVWLIDQSDTKGKNHGGTLYIFDGQDLTDNPESAAARERIDLSGEVAALCLSATGANPVRPHMLLFSQTDRHAILSFVASGHVVILDAVTRKPLSCLRTTQSPTGRQAHAAYASPDGTYIVVANQNGKRLERIDTDFRTNTFTHNTSATLDLATCTTPGGRPCESAELRPDNAPICPIVDANSALTFVTLRGGGLFVVDARRTPMQIVGEYDKNTVKGNGCGGVETNGSMYINSGGRPGNLAHLSLYGFDVYRFPLSGYAANNAANTPAPTVVFSAAGERDSHGMASVSDGRALWVMDRHANLAEVISTSTGARVRSVALTGALTSDPAPDLAHAAPNGQRIFVALRGAVPLSGDPHIATGSTPGLGIIDVAADGTAGSLRSILRISNVDDNGVDRADVHAVRVRLK